MLAFPYAFSQVGIVPGIISCPSPPLLDLLPLSLVDPVS